MRVLLDECLDPRFCGLFARHEAESMKSMGWLGMSNGELLGTAQGEFDAFLTIDRRLPFQQNLASYDLAVIVVRGSRNDPDLAPEMIAAVEELLDAGPRTGVHWVDID